MSVTVSAKQSPLYTVGTLSYTQQGLFLLFFWLMWNDFSVTLIEQVNGVGQFLMKDQGATSEQIFILGLPGLLLFWLNPFVSTWSDRFRSKWGRRRPFLFWSTPFFAFFLALYPYVPTIHAHMMRYPAFAEIDAHMPMKGVLIMMALCGFIQSIFNGVLLAIFSYLYWDVVPESHLARFQSLSGIVVRLASLFSSFCLFPLAVHHMKGVYVITASFCLIVYLISVWQIKEGEYPPPDSRKKLEALDPIQTYFGTITSPTVIRFWAWLAPVRAYFTECFSKPYYLWIFFASFLYQFGNMGGMFQGFYLHYELGFGLDILGPVQGWGNLASLGFGMLCGFWLGTITDKLKPVRLMGFWYIILGLVHGGSFYFVHDQWTYMITVCVTGILQFGLGVAFGAFQVEVFPREKLGQFCSAQAAFYQLLLKVLGPSVGHLFDWLNNNRLGYIWQGCFYLLAAIVYFKVYINWKRRKGVTPVPHAG